MEISTFDGNNNNNKYPHYGTYSFSACNANKALPTKICNRGHVYTYGFDENLSCPTCFKNTAYWIDQNNNNEDSTKKNYDSLADLLNQLEVHDKSSKPKILYCLNFKSDNSAVTRAGPKHLIVDSPLIYYARMTCYWCFYTRILNVNFPHLELNTDVVFNLMRTQCIITCTKCNFKFMVEPHMIHNFKNYLQTFNCGTKHLIDPDHLNYNKHLTYQILGHLLPAANFNNFLGPGLINDFYSIECNLVIANHVRKSKLYKEYTDLERFCEKKKINYLYIPRLSTANLFAVLIAYLIKNKYISRKLTECLELLENVIKDADVERKNIIYAYCTMPLD